MDGVATVLNISDLGTKKLTKVLRRFLMYLIGLVEYDPNIKGYTCAGEEFNLCTQRKYMGQSMKAIRRVVLGTLSAGAEEFPVHVSKPLVKALTLLSLQPLVGGTRSEEVEYALMVKHCSYVVLFMDYPGFMFGYALTFILVGIVIGYFLKKATHKWELSSVHQWAAAEIEENTKDIIYVDDWDPDLQEIRQFRVLKSVDDAESGEEYFRETPGGLARFVKLDLRRRDRHGFAESNMMDANFIQFVFA